MNAEPQSAEPEREAHWKSLIREAQADPEWAPVMAKYQEQSEPGGLPSEPSWNDLGDRGRIAKILYAEGLRGKARRFADCCRVGFRRICSNNPEHKFYSLFACGLRFCQACAPKLFRQLFGRYAQPVAAFVKQHSSLAGYTLAHFDFTIRASGKVPTPEDIRVFNRAIRNVLKRAVA